MTQLEEEFCSKIYLIAPLHKGNPCFSFRVDLKHGFLTCGYATGGVTCWLLPRHLGGLESQFSKDDNKHFTNAPLSKYSKFYCRQLLEYDDESIRHIYIKKNNCILSVVGDVHIRQWDHYHVNKSAKLPYSKSIYKKEVEDDNGEITTILEHDGWTCHRTQILCKNEHLLMYRNSNSDEIYYFNLEKFFKNQQPKIVRLEHPLEESAQIMDFDGNRFIYKKINKNGSKIIGVVNLNLKDSKNALEVYTFELQRAKKDYWGFQLFGDYCVYVSNQNILKIFDLNTSKVIYKLKGHSNYILGFHFFEDKIISLGSDNCIRIWNTKNGKIIYVKKNISGQFVPGYVYKIELIGNKIFYSADDGIYGFQYK